MALEEVDPSFDLVTADNAIDAVHKLSMKEISPDIIFLDVNMPRVNGWDCLTRLKEIDHLQDTRIVIYSTSHKIPAEYQDGIAAFLPKQATISELVIRLRELFSIINA